MPNRITHKTRQRGAALITVLWIALFLSVLIATTLSTVRTEIRIAAAHIRLFEARQATDAAITLAAYRLATQHNATNTASSNTTVMIGDKRVSVTSFDEAYKLDINTATPEALGNGLQRYGYDAKAAAALADNILDWRDADNLKRINGAEANDYAAKRSPFRPQNRPFVDMQELRQVLDINQDTVDCLLKDVTIFGRANAPFQEQTKLNADGETPSTRLATQAVRSAVGKRYTLTAEVLEGGVKATGRQAILITARTDAPFQVVAKLPLQEPSC
ncbi:MAG: hypothetical protein AAGC95_16310 [Pseudomonadota bacterium]